MKNGLTSRDAKHSAHIEFLKIAESPELGARDVL
jgi:hypothetical protein